MKKKKILIHSIVFSPDGVSTAYLYNDIALNFVKENYEVTVLTTTPHYNVIKDELEKQPLKKKWAGLYYSSDYHGIKVLHVPQKKFKSTFFRILGFVYWHVLSLALGLSQKNVDLILSPSPPLTIGLISLLVARIKKAKVIYNVQEIYPDFLINQGLLKSNLIIKALKKLERFVYDKSDAVVTIDQLFYNSIKTRFRDKSKLSIIPNFVDTSVYKPVPEDELQLNRNVFPKSKNLKVMYAGNIGYAQDWEPLIEVAKKMIDLPVEFWVIGEGVQRLYLEKSIKDNGLDNIHVMGYQPRKTIASIISYADIHFIFMLKLMEKQGFPSKVYSIMACAKPLLILSGKDTPLSNFLRPTGSAFTIECTGLEAKVAKLYAALQLILSRPDSLSDMGKKGFDVIHKSYTKEIITEKYLSLAQGLL
jgi:glycosyltransferase involved in cell wall biosynthesis